MDTTVKLRTAPTVKMEIQPDRRSGGRAPLLERSEQLEALEAAVSDVRSSGRGHLALVAGEAGIGKTTLLRTFSENLRVPMRVRWAGCDPVLTPRPLGPLLDVAEPLADELASHLVDNPPPYEVAGALLDELRRKGPAVIVIEDIHWADEATLDVLRFVSRRMAAVPALFVLSYRDDEVPRAHPLQVFLGDLQGGAVPTRVMPRRLSPVAVRELAAPIGVDPEELYEGTGGNPFFVTEVLAAADSRLPHTVRDAVLARCARLSMPARKLLDAAAVVPGRAEVWLLEALAPEAAGHLEQCLDAGVLVADRGIVAFRHELARLVVEDSLPPDRRLFLHRRALSALARVAPGAVDVTRLSYHAEAAADAGAVLRFAPAAAARAAAAGAHREAQVEYARALRFAGGLSPQDRARLLHGFAAEAYRAGTMHKAATALDEALTIHRKSGDRNRQAETLCLLARVLGALGRHDAAESAAVEAVAICEQLPRGVALARAYITLSGVRGLADDEEGIRLAMAAKSLAEEIGDTATLIHVLNNLGVIELRRSIPEGLKKLEQSRALAETAGDHFAVGRAHLHMAWLLVHGRDCLAAERHLPAAIEYCHQHGFDEWVHWLTALEAELALARGRKSEAEMIANSLLEPDTRAGPPSRCLALLVLATLRARRGQEDVWDLLDEAAELAEAGRLPHLLTALAVARLEVAWLVNRRCDVDGDSELELGDSAKLEPCFAYQLLCWRRRAGLPTDEIAALPEPYRSQMAGDHQRAATWWAEHGCPYEAALACYDSGEPEALRHALHELRRLGARAAAAIVARRLQEAGETQLPRGPRPTTSAHPAGLTVQQARVLALLADGLANREIAAHLSVSLRTVDHHVAAILRKLQVNDRRQARAVAIELGIISPS